MSKFWKILVVIVVVVLLGSWIPGSFDDVIIGLVGAWTTGLIGKGK